MNANKRHVRQKNKFLLRRRHQRPTIFRPPKSSAVLVPNYMNFSRLSLILLSQLSRPSRRTRNERSLPKSMNAEHRPRTHQIKTFYSSCTFDAQTAAFDSLTTKSHSTTLCSESQTVIQVEKLFSLRIFVLTKLIIQYNLL